MMMGRGLGGRLLQSHGMMVLMIDVMMMRRRVVMMMTMMMRRRMFDGMRMLEGGMMDGDCVCLRDHFVVYLMLYRYILLHVV